jgi:hypothetical protein
MNMKKMIQCGLILTVAFGFVVILGPALGSAESPKRIIVGLIVIGFSIVVSARICAQGSAESDDHHRKH